MKHNGKNRPSKTQLAAGELASQKVSATATAAATATATANANANAFATATGNATATQKGEKVSLALSP